MSVYVDELFTVNGKQWCHMATDSDISELHEMARKIGLKRSWFQNKRGRNQPHYDLRPSKRMLAIKNGAVSVDARELYMRCFATQDDVWLGD